METNQKGIAPAIIILLGAILLAAGGLLVKQVLNSQKEAEQELLRQSDLAAKSNERMGDGVLADGETADWQTYRNEKYGFEIKYPKDWVAVQNKEEIVAIGNEVTNSGFHIEALSNENKLSFDQWYKQEIADKNKTDYISEKTVINGIDAEVFDTVYHAVETRGVEGLEAYLADKQGRIIHIVAAGHGTKIVFDQMLSTFKFIASQKEGETAYSMVKTAKGFLFPEVTSLGEEDIKAKVNARLKKEAENLCECGDIGKSSGCDVDAEVTYSSSDIFSLAVSYNWTCEKQLHDARGFSRFVFDMKTGETVGFEDVFGAPASPVGSGRQISDELVALIKKNVKNIPECAEAYQGEYVKNYSYSYFITDKGFVFTPKLPYAGMACTQDINVPATEVEPFAMPGSILERLAPPVH